MIEPISPLQVESKKETLLPDFVTEAFNVLIAKNFSSNSSTFKKCDVVELIIKTSPEPITSKIVYDNKWLNVEGIYRNKGWSVKYDSSDYTESWFEPTYTFSTK